VNKHDKSNIGKANNSSHAANQIVTKAFFPVPPHGSGGACEYDACRGDKQIRKPRAMKIARLHKQTEVKKYCRFPSYFSLLLPYIFAVMPSGIINKFDLKTDSLHSIYTDCCQKAANDLTIPRLRRGMVNSIT